MTQQRAIEAVSDPAVSYQAVSDPAMSDPAVSDPAVSKLMSDLRSGAATHEKSWQDDRAGDMAVP